ncbi:MAG TPA: thioredoxin domain-containing protein [Thermoplasmata archaeon]|jgi:thioredoxin 1|nr:thioredoxin domain-containing protein [Thermoplasmata archaeon]
MYETANPVPVNDATFEAEVLRSELPVVVDFYAEWCRPCRVTEPMVRDLSARLAGRVKFATVNVDEATQVTRSYGIHSIPTFLFLEAGHERGREVGPLDPVAFRELLKRAFVAPRPARAAAVSGGRPASR